MLDSLITSRTRIKLLVKFFLNTSVRAYLRGLAEEFGESTNAIRLELNHLEEAGLLKSEAEGNKKVYCANKLHPLYEDIRHLVLKHSGITQIIEQVVLQVGDIDRVWVCGDFARGKDSQTVDIVIAGEIVNLPYFISLIEKAERIIHRKICYTLITPEVELSYFSPAEKMFLVWKK